MNDPALEDQANEAAALASDLVQRCSELLSDLTRFQQFLASHKKQHTVELRQFKSNVQSELKSLEKISKRDSESPQLLHTLRSSNLPFYETVWAVARRQDGVVAFGKRYYWDGAKSSGEAAARRQEAAKNDASEEIARSRKKNVLVDIVANGGLKWIKVSTVTETRLLFEMAKKGWEVEDSEEEEGDEEGMGRRPGAGSESDDEMELVKLAQDLKLAASDVRINYRRPRVHFVLPKITEGAVAEIDRILADIRVTGAIIECGGASASSSTPTNGSTAPEPAAATSSPDEDLESAFSHLLIQDTSHLTQTLNVDCTLLLAVISDLSNYKEITPSPTHHRAIKRQIALEQEEALLPSSLWPVMGSHSLICTHEAAQRMREIVATIGTETEKTRMDLLMGEGSAAGCSQEILVQKFQELSGYAVPLEWQLPLREVDATAELEAGSKEKKLPAVAEKVAAELSVINRSVFLYGWMTGITTISSNRTIVKQIEGIVERNRDGDESLKGPEVWICGTARSLIGKERNRK